MLCRPLAGFHYSSGHGKSGDHVFCDFCFQSDAFPDKQASPQPQQPKEVHQEQLASESPPETKVMPDEYAKAVPQKITESAAPTAVMDFEPATVEEAEKMSK